MKRVIALLIAFFTMTVMLAACGSSGIETSDADAQSSESTAEVQSDENESADGKSIVIYFNYSENIDTAGLDVDTITSASLRGGSTGNNTENLKVMVDEVKALKNADVFSIQVNEVYPPVFEDMTGIAEQDITDNKQFTFREELTNLDEYDTVYFGAPVWWGELPQPVHVFFQQYDFSGKTIIPFGIHHGSRFGSMIEQMREYEPDASILDGFTIDADTDNDEVKSEFDDYLDSLN